MFAIIGRRRLRVPRKDGIFVGPQFFAPQNAVLAKSFSSRRSSSDVCGGDPNQSFTVSYLINSCGLSSKDVVSVSKKLCINSREKPDAVLELLRKYGFTNAYISRLVTRWPLVLQSSPNKTLLPKLEFFRSIGVPDAVSARKLSVYPLILQRSLENYLIPLYNYLKSLFQSDKKVVNVFARAPSAFAHGLQRDISSNIATLRERGVPESSIASIGVHQPSLLMLGKETFSVYVDRAAGMGFDNSKIMFVLALQVFAAMSESTLKHKMDVYKRCGWSKSNITGAFLRHPLCMTLSEKKITTNMDFLVNEVGFKPVAVAQCPALLGLSVDKRMRPRWIVTRILNAKGLSKKKKKSTGVINLLKMSEEKFLKRYIVDHQEDVPQLLDIYQGKLSLPEMGFSRDVISK